MWVRYAAYEKEEKCVLCFAKETNRKEPLGRPTPPRNNSVANGSYAIMMGWHKLESSGSRQEKVESSVTLFVP